MTTESPAQSNSTLPPIWLQASVLGSLWAASEIILGSFFHSLHLPLRSIILASIGVVLMVAIGRRWNVKGLFWRAGLICALMKSISPGGVILSPMVAIAAQGMLMEMATRISGRNLVGFLLGGILALTWNLVQNIAYHILIYGYDIVDIYKKIYKIATEVFPLPEGDFWLPVYVSLAIHMIFGATAAIAGYLLAGADPRHMLTEGSLKSRDIKYFQQSLSKKKAWPAVFLYVNVILFVAYFITASLLKFPWNIIPAAPILLFWLIKYRSNLRVLKKPVFWIVFVFITFVSAIIINQTQQGFGQWSLEGLWIGLSMNVRAFTLVIGFSVIGYELANPTIKHKLKRRGAQRLFLAMEAASKTLPVIIANLPGAAVFFTRPRAVFLYLIHKTTGWLWELESSMVPHPQMILITGSIHAGKTTFIRQVLAKLHEGGLRSAGFVCRAYFEQDERKGYDLLDTYENQCFAMARTDVESEIQIGSYYVSQQGLDFGYSLLQDTAIKDCDLVVIDEIGPWELSGNGWAHELPRLLQHQLCPMIWVVRRPILQKVIEKWNLVSPLIIDVEVTDMDMGVKLLLERMYAIKERSVK